MGDYISQRFFINRYEKRQALKRKNLNSGIPVRNGVVILEGLNLTEVPTGDDEWIALPIKVKGADRAPVRAVLKELN